MAKADLQFVLSLTVSQFEKAVKKAARSVVTLEKSVDSSVRNIGGAFNRLPAMITGAVAGISLGELIRGTFDAGAFEQNLTRSFGVITGSARQAADEITFIRDLSEQLGTNFRSSADAYKQLIAAANGTPLAGNPIREIFTGISEAATVLGMSKDEINGSLLAISQMISKGKVAAEELRGQLGERLPGAFQLAAKAMGVTTAQLDKMLSAGEVTAEEMLPALAKALHDQYGDAAVKMSNGAVQAVNRFQNAWLELKAKVAESGVLDTMTDYLNRATAALRDPEIMNQVKAGIKTALAAMDMAGRFMLFLKGVFETVAAASLLVSAGIFRVGQALGWLTDKIGLTKNAADKWKESAQAAFGAAGETIKQAAGSFSAMKKGLSGVDASYRKTGTAAKLAFSGTADAAKKSADSQKQVTGKALKEMKRQYRKYADEVIRLNNEIANRQRSLTEQLRAMGRSGMTDLQAWRDRKKEAQEYEQAARKAAEAGDFKTAVQYADMAKRAYADLNKEVKVSTEKMIAMKKAEAEAIRNSGWSKGSYQDYLRLQREILALERKVSREGSNSQETVISKQHALKEAMAGVKRAGELAISALRQQQDEAKKAMEAMTKKSGFADLEKGMDVSKKKWLDNWKAMQAATMRELDKVEQRIRKITSDKHMTIYVNEVVKKAVGGAVRRLASGGRLAGFGGGDRIPALLEAGEYVIRKEAVARFGEGIFHALNSLRYPPIPRFASGGPVAAGSGGSTVNINLTIGQDGPYHMQTDPMTTEKMLRDLARRRRLRSS